MEALCSPVRLNCAHRQVLVGKVEQKAAGGFRVAHCVAGVDVPTGGQVLIDDLRLVLLTGLPEVVFVHVVRLQTSRWSVVVLRQM